MKFVKYSAVAMLVPFAATAGSIEPVVEEPVIEAAPVLTYGNDWTGGYVGLSVGAADVSTDGGATLEGDGTLYGAHAGYDYDFGSFVVGGELDWQTGEVDIGGGAEQIDSVTRLKLRAGFDAGKALVYATAGGARADTSLGRADGWLAGVGVDYMVTDNWAVGGEFLYHQFDDAANSGINVQANTLSLRAAYRF